MLSLFYIKMYHCLKRETNSRIPLSRCLKNYQKEKFPNTTHDSSWNNSFPNKPFCSNSPHLPLEALLLLPSAQPWKHLSNTLLTGTVDKSIFRIPPPQGPCSALLVPDTLSTGTPWPLVLNRSPTHLSPSPGEPGPCNTGKPSSLHLELLCTTYMSVFKCLLTKEGIQYHHWPQAVKAGRALSYISGQCPPVLPVRKLRPRERSGHTSQGHTNDHWQSWAQAMFFTLAARSSTPHHPIWRPPHWAATAAKKKETHYLPQCAWFRSQETGLASRPYITVSP